MKGFLIFLAIVALLNNEASAAMVFLILACMVGNTTRRRA